MKQILHLFHLHDNITKQLYQVCLDNESTLKTINLCEQQKQKLLILKDEIDSIINHKELLAGHAIKTRLHNCCPNLVMQRVLMNKENSKMNESHIFGLNL